MRLGCPGGLRLTARPALAAVLAAAALTLGPAGTEAAWLQAGYDAARTGATPDHGPDHDDVAFTLQLPGSNAFHMAPLIVNGSLYVLTADYGYGPSLTTDGLWRVDLATAEAGLVLRLGPRPTAFAVLGDRIVVARDHALDGYGVDGHRLWTLPFARLVAMHNWTLCKEPAVREGTVYFACYEIGSMPTEGAAAPYGQQMAVFAVAVEAASGRERWTWVKGAWDEAQVIGGPPLASSPVQISQSTNTLSLVYGVSVIGSYVFLSTSSLHGRGGILEDAMWALREETGDYAWSMNATAPAVTTLEPYTLLGSSGFVSGFATGGSTQVYFRLVDLVAVNPAGPREIWRAAIGQEDGPRRASGTGVGLHGDALFVTSWQTLYRYNTTTRDRAWAYTLPAASNETWGTDSLVVADGVVYARTRVGQQQGERPTNVFYAIDAATGQALWRHPFSNDIQPWLPIPRHFSFAVAEGVMVVAGSDGSVTVLGRTAASLQPAVSASSLHPAPGEEVRLDATATGPGIHGAATEYEADWGDGNRTTWQASSVLRHAYSLSGDYNAIVRVRNAAGQSASEELTLRVGASSPVVVAAPPAPLATAAPVGVASVFDYWMLAPIGAIAAGAALLLGTRAPRPQRAPATLAPGVMVLGRYRVLRSLGSGGSGAAFLCRDERFGRQVVLKRVRTPGPDSLRAVLREAQALSGVRHAHVVALHAVEKMGEEALLVMEYAEAGSLADRLLRGPLDGQELRRLVRGTLDALAAVHAAGMVHRDVKPSNILMTRDGSPKLADFGVAHLPGFETTMGGPIGAAVGTVRFMSPEQARGKRAVPQSDLFSAAATFYEAYTGQPYLAPEDGESAMEVQLRAAKAGPFRRPFQGPDALRVWFARALEPVVEARFRSAAEMRRAFDLAVAGR